MTSIMGAKLVQLLSCPTCIIITRQYGTSLVFSGKYNCDKAIICLDLLITSDGETGLIRYEIGRYVISAAYQLVTIIPVAY